MAAVLGGEYRDYFDDIITIDSRFAYEYDGGHIKRGINVNDATELQNRFFNTVRPRSAIFFHCEFSQSRGPELAALLRDLDRKINENIYPKLHYPHVYVISGGYSEFFQKCPEWCDGGYIRMVDARAQLTGELVSAHSEFWEKLATARKALRTNSAPQSSNREAPGMVSPKAFRIRRRTTA